MTVFLRVPPLITLGQNEGRSQYSVALEDAETANLIKWAPVLEAKLRTLPDLTDIFSDLRLASPRLDVVIDRDRALALGVSPDAIANTLYSAYGDRRIATITAATNEYDVILEVLPEDQRDPAALSKLYLRNAANKLIPLAAVTQVRQSVAPLSVNHIGQLPAVNFQFNLKPGVALSQATQADRRRRARDWAARYHDLQLSGDGAGVSEFIARVTILLLIAVVVIYLVLGNSV